MVAEAEVKKAVDILKILSSRTRFKIISLLMQAPKELCVNEISKAIGMSHSATSHQLSKLEDRGIVISNRVGQTICYEIKRSKVTGELLTIVDKFV
jgi:DNA-binding transcriptional ArsR family regulator